MAARQQLTREWWETRISAFDCFVSQLVIDECAAGDAEAAARRLARITPFPSLAITPEVDVVAKSLLARGLIPVSAADDAVHIAVSAVHGMHFLLTWNFKHIANAEKEEVIRLTCQENGFVCPVICTPEELMED
jgi:hypothetical protein